MGLTKLNVFVSGMDDPCTIDSRPWYVTIYNCDGDVLEYCGKRYVMLEAPCGHLETEVPPGCYRIIAVWNFKILIPGLHFRVNHFTDSAIVTVCCGQETCVKLFNPSAHRCGEIYVRALRDLVAQKAIAGDLAQQVKAAVEGINRQLGRPVKLFELAHMDEIEEFLVKEGETAKKGDGPKTE